MGPLTYLVRADVRARRGRLAAVAALIGALVATVCASGALAHRVSTAFARRMAAGHAADVRVDPGDRTVADLVSSPAPRLAAVPGVRAEVRFGGVFVFFPDVPGLDLAGILSGAGGFVSVAAIDDPTKAGVDVPVVSSGRLPDWSRADEIFVSPSIARRAGWRVGERVRMQYFGAAVSGISADQPDFAEQAAALSASSTVTVTVAGTGNFAAASRRQQDLVLTTPAFVRQYRPVAQYSVNAVALAPHTTTAQLIERAERTTGIRYVVDQDTATVAKEYADSVRPQVTSLLVFAALVAAVGVLVAGNALAREAQSSPVELQRRRGLGLTRRQLVAVQLGRVAVPVVVGALVAVGVAAAISGSFDHGPARSLDPVRGPRFDSIVVVGIAAALVLTLLLVVLPSVLRSTRPSSSAGARRASVATALAALGAPVPVVVGARHALEPGGGRTAVPVRTAIGVAIVAASVSVAAGVFSSSLHHLVTHPSAYGVHWDVELGATVDPNRDCAPGTARCDTDAVLDARAVEMDAYAASDPAVRASTPVTSIEVVAGGTPLSVFGFGSGPHRPSLLSGSLPGDGEIALGVAELRARHLHVGQVLTTKDGIELRITGTVVPPPATGGQVSAALGRGGVTTYATAKRLARRENTGLLLTVRDPPQAGSVIERFRSEHASLGESEAIGASRPGEPGQIIDYRSVGSTPTVLALVLALLGLATLVLAVVSSVRRRAGDLAVLRALGASRRQATATVVAQAVLSMVPVVGVGVPLGLLLGHSMWARLERSLGTLGGWSWPAAALGWSLAAGGAALVAVATLVALLSVRRPPAGLLRSE